MIVVLNTITRARRRTIGSPRCNSAGTSRSTNAAQPRALRANAAIRSALPPAGCASAGPNGALIGRGPRSLARLGEDGRLPEVEIDRVLRAQERQGGRISERPAG